jgi:hypothetical protein
LRARCDVDDSADRRQIAMRPAELAKTNDPTIDPKRLYIAIQGSGQLAMLVATAAMYFARRLDRFASTSQRILTILHE